MQRQREKLLHAIVFFHEHTFHCHETKLYKLLHFFDFEIFSKTGAAPTGLIYYAYPMGPVPKQLRGELREPPADLRAAMKVTVGQGTDDRGRVLTIQPRIEFNAKLFSRRELRVMDELAEIYRDARADDMSKASHDRLHAHGWPWHEVHEVERNEWAPISYDLALEREGAISKERAEEIAADMLALAGLVR